jgi:PAS domain S-box-containing protein
VLPAAPADDAERLQLLEALRVLDTPPEPSFDAVARLAAGTTGCSMAALCFIDAERLWCKASVGIEAQAITRADAFCAHAILQDEPLLVDDASLDPRFATHPLVARPPAVRACAAAPVLVEGRAVGTIAVFDPTPRRLDARVGRALLDVARLAADLLHARLVEQRAGRAAHELATAEERWKYALEVSSQGVWDWDLAQQRMYLSPGCRALLGLADDERLDVPLDWARRIHPDDLGAARARLFGHLRGDTDTYIGEYRMRHGDGRWLWVHNRGKVVQRNDAGRAQRVVGTLVDVTERRAAETALRDKQAAELASRAKSRFLSRMSHEMRTPLNAMLGFAQLLAEAPVDAARVRDYAEHVLGAGRQLLEMVDRVLDLQRVDEERVDLRIGPVALAPLVARAVDAVRADAEARGVHLSCEVPDGADVQADASLLFEALRQLSLNAVRYNRPAGLVRWFVEPSGDGRLALVVEDSGAGMCDAQMARLFQPFERLGRETGPIEGSGLGLILARAQVDALGGRLTITSRAGQGTRATVELPRARSDSAPAAVDATAPPTAAAAAPADAPLRLLYVEDNRVNALLFGEAVRVMGNVELRVAEDGREAIETVAGWQPDLLVLDAHLPGMTGYEVLEQLRKRPGLERTPAVMCSADAMPDDLARARRAGFVGYWTKPIDLSRVMADLQRFAAAP